MPEQTATTPTAAQLDAILRDYRILNTSRHDSDAWYRSASVYVSRRLAADTTSAAPDAATLETLLRAAEAANTIEKHGSLHWVSFHAEHVAASLAASAATGNDDRLRRARKAADRARVSSIGMSAQERENLIALDDEVTRLSALVTQHAEQDTDGDSDSDSDSDYPTPGDIIDEEKSENDRLRARVCEQDAVIQQQKAALSAIATLTTGLTDLAASITTMVDSTRG